MSDFTFAEIVQSEKWGELKGQMRHLMLYETLKEGIELQDDIITNTQDYLTNMSPQRAKEYKRKAFRYLRDELSNNQRKEFGISDKTWRSWSGM